ncbi:LysR family transcriptional regulator [Pseudochelatococcus contaminans]|uniref:DNA-binding transcriptional LysR family regulator n=1 Tax=Pseudochelatococcus contaminans TaxID=1538103 RepID=A0A7W5Z589_9HYPH|nr:LysR family transcriptional regulator [Pseudochelatococcus contaminans]MBB3810430.1 DNA-binding transcriptional LysR family regulator [Pseudochelatococcus contaminans]
MDSFGSLNAFVQAAELRSFTAAGQKLGISSSAISKAVARLEERLGVRLFHRSTRTVTLTPEGALFLERCRRIFCEIEAAELELSQTSGEPRGKLRVSLPLVGMLMMPTLAAFMRAWPEIELDLDFSDRLVDVIEEGFDAVVRTGEVSDSRLMTRKLGTFRYKLIGSPAYFTEHGKPKTPADLSAHHGLRHLYPSMGKIEDWPLHDRGSSTPADIPTTAVASAIEPLIYLAEQGLGLACLPDFAIRDQLAKGLLVSVLEDAVKHSGTFRILWPSSRHLSPKLRVFVDFMTENLFKQTEPPLRDHPCPGMDVCQ